MGSFCDLQVDVNGEGIFMLDKGVLCSYSGRLRKLLCNSVNREQNLKVIFHDFPGGAEIFELLLRFCYSNGCIEISPSNIILLHRAANFMEMNKFVSGKENLLEHAERLMEELSYWSWSDILGALKQSQDFSSGPNSMQVIQKLLDALLSRLALASESSPCLSMSSPDSFGFRYSCDSRSSQSFRTCSSRTTWWFEDLVVLDLDIVEMLTKIMLVRRFDHALIGRFLLYYKKAKLASCEYEEKCKIVEMVIDMLSSLDNSSVSYKSLFEILRSSLNLKISKRSLGKLEGLIGSRMDEATLDNLLLPAPSGVNYLYDVTLVLRLLKSFVLGRSCETSSHGLRKVATLMDLYLSEVAPDPSLDASTFISLAMMLPDSARESFDKVYHAIDMYFEVHSGLSEEEKLDICCVLNYEKLSSETCFHLAQNLKFPSRSAAQALICEQNKLKGLLRYIRNPNQPNDASSCSYFANISIRETTDERSSNEQIGNYVESEPEVMSEKEMLKSQLQGMQLRVMELKKVCHKMQSQLTKITRTRSSSSQIAVSRSLPKLCS